MAIAASDFTIEAEAWLGPNVKMVIGTYTPSGTYTSGGEALTHTIALRGMGLKQVHALQFMPLVDADNATSIAVGLAFDHVSTSTTHGKIRALNTGQKSHTHDLSVIGGQGAAATDTVTCPAATDLLGKQEAGNALVLGADVATKGGVVASTASLAGSEAAAGAALSGYVARYVAYGV